MPPGLSVMEGMASYPNAESGLDILALAILNSNIASF
jgi:hypothetical protein